MECPVTLTGRDCFFLFGVHILFHFRAFHSFQNWGHILCFVALGYLTSQDLALDTGAGFVCILQLDTSLLLDSHQSFHLTLLFIHICDRLNMSLEMRTPKRTHSVFWPLVPVVAELERYLRESRVVL